MKTICFFNSTKIWGGGEKWHYEISSYMHSKGYNVLVITNDESELFKKLEKTSIKCIGVKVNNQSFLNAKKINIIKNILINNNVETILINLSRDLKVAGLAAKRANIKNIIYGRGIAYPIKNSLLNRYYFKNIVTGILANSLATKKTILQNNSFLFPEDKIKVIYNGIDLDDFISRKTTPVYYKTSKEEIVITSLGRLEEEKNHSFLIFLSAELKKRNISHKILIGGDGSLKNQLIKTAIKHNVQKNIEFLGYVDNPKNVINSGDIFMLPSLWEGFGYVLAEASLCKKPVIAFNTTSIPEIILNKKSGYIIAPNNVNAVADKVEILKENNELRDKMGEEGFNHAIKTFDSKIIFQKIENYLAHNLSKNQITALLITYNEIHNIDTILENISFANEIIVVDSYSTDGTVERIKQHKKVKLIQREFKNYTDQKAFALEQAAHNWVLFLDADERLNNDLQNEILEITNSNSPTADAYYFYRTFMFKDQVLRFSGSQSDKNYRLFKKDKVHFEENRTVHETLVVKGTSAVLENKLIHFCYRSYKEYKGKMIKYGQMKAFDELKKDYTPNAFHFIIKPTYKFLYNYILRLGVLDGKKGIIISYLSALGVHARYKELKRLRNEAK